MNLAVLISRVNIQNVNIAIIIKPELATKKNRRLLELTLTVNMPLIMPVI